MKISIIAAMGKNRELGFGGKLPWHLPDDLARFKKITRGHAVIMGRKTYESIGRPLPERKNIIITRNLAYQAPGCATVNSIEGAMEQAGDDGEIFVIGGAEIYKLALPYADKVYLTVVDGEFKADAFFPTFNEDEWNVVVSETGGKDEKNPFGRTYLIYERKK